MKKLFSKIMALILMASTIASFSLVGNIARAQEVVTLQENITTVEQLEKLSPDEITYDVLSQVGTVQYYNEATGEYLIWTDSNSSAKVSQQVKAVASGTTIKSFSFNIVSSVKSSAFTMPTSSAKVKINKAIVTDADGKEVSGYNGYKYCVDLQKTSSLLKKTANLYVNSVTTATISGLSSGSKYYLYVRNPGTFYGAGTGTRYLKGNGTLVTP